LVISHQKNLVGRTYASIDAVSKPTKRLVASGGYDPVVTRQRIAEWKQKEANMTERTDRTNSPAATVRSGGLGEAALPKSGAAAAPQPAEPEIDPEVGF
jgi:hypothetical protein